MLGKAERNIKMFVAMSLLFILLAGCGSNADVVVPIPLESGMRVRTYSGHITETATFIPVVVGGTTMEIMLVRASDNTVRAVLNTCENCHVGGRAYYVQLGNIVICQQCQMPFPVDEIGMASAGCQPIAIGFSVENEYIVISYDTLSANAHWFLNWRR